MSEPTLKKVQLVINKMTREQYQDLSSRGEISPEQLYLLPEDEDVKPIWGNITGNLEDQEDLAQKLAEIDESTEDLDQRITGVSQDLGELREDVELSAYNIDQALQLSVHNLDASLQTKATRDNISISYSDTTKKITLNADGHSTEIDAQDFIKDGMVESARYDAPSKKIIITFNTDAGKSPISVDVAALIHEYTAGDGLQLSGNQFSIDNTVATKQYVNTAAAGTLQDAEEYTDGKIVQVRSELANVSVEIEGDIPTKLSELDNDVGYLSAHQSLSAYATKTELDKKVNKDETTNAQYVRIYKAFDLDKNAIELNVGSHTHRPNIVVEYRDAENTLELPEKDGVIAVTSDIPTKVSQLQNDAGYLSAHQSLTAYATKDELSDYAPINSPHFVGDVWVNDWDNIVRKNGQSLEGRLGDFLTNDAAERDYAKLSSIPTVNNPEIILKQGNVEKGRFTLNQASGSTITFDEPGDDALWGNISGDLSAQADLVNALKSKATLSADNVFTGNISAYFSQVFDPTTSPLSSILELLDNPMWLAIVTRTNEIIRFTDLDEEVVPVTVTVADLVQKVEDVSEALGYGPIDITQDDIFDVLIEKVIERLNLIASDYEINGISLEKRLKNVEANVRDCIFWGDFTRQCLSGFATETYVRNQLLTKPNFSDIGNGEITIRQNGQVKGKFTLNQTSSLTINLSAGGGGEVVQATWGGIEGDITDQQDLVNYVGSATYLAINEAKGYTDSQVSSKTELSAVQQWVGSQGFQNAQQVNSAITAATQGLATYQQLTGAIEDEDTAIKQYIEDQHHINSQQAQQLIDASIVGKADKNELSGYAKKENVKIGYSSATHIITLSADGVTSTIDASDFIKDGMVDSARYDAASKKIVISFNTDAGKTPISVDVAAMVHEYSAGTGLNLNGSTFSVDNTIATKDYANTAASGALQDAEEYTDSQIAQLDIPTKTSDLVNDSGFLTEHQSLTAYALKTEIPTVGNGSITIKQGDDIKGTFTMNQSNNLTVELSAGGSGGGGDETDPVFTAWLSSDAVRAGNGSTVDLSTSIAIGKGSFAKAGGVAIGEGAVADGYSNCIAIGKGAHTYNSYSIQIGEGSGSGGELKIFNKAYANLLSHHLYESVMPYPVTILSGEDANGVVHTYKLFMQEVH